MNGDPRSRRRTANDKRRDCDPGVRNSGQIQSLSDLPAKAAVVSDYLLEAFHHREFWLSLAATDLRGRFRGTALGIFWVIVHPLAFTLLLSLVFHFLFNQSFSGYSIYIFSGLIFWNWLSETVMIGANSLVSAHPFIKQRRLPMIVYVLRTCTLVSVTYLLSFIGFLIWCLLTGHVPGERALVLIVNIPLLALCILPLATISAVLGALYRDFPQLSQIVLQGLWFTSPVFIDKSVFARPELSLWDAINPVSSMLDLVRAPLLSNEMPPFSSYLVTLVFLIASSLLAVYLLSRHERNLVYYL